MNDRTAKHSKKRNVGLMYEFLLRTISRSLVENDSKRSGTALRILKKHFKPGSELYREFRLFNSLVKTTVSSDAVASSIIVEAKAAARAIDLQKLEKDKTAMIHEINRLIADESFYDQPISEYKTYATIGTLLNAWRDPVRYDLSKVASYEEKLVEWLRSSKTITEKAQPDQDSPGVNRLVFKVMTKKLNEKYGSVLSEDQKSLVREYALYGITGADDTVKEKLKDVKSKVMTTIDRHREGLPEHTSTKLKEARELIQEDTIATIDDAVVSKYMSYLKLVAELESPEENNG